MTRRGGRRWAAIAVGLCVVAAVVANGGLTSASARSQAPVEASTAAAVVDPCPGDLIAIDTAETPGPTMCTHGPDPGVRPDDLTATGSVAEHGAAEAIQCYGNGTDGARVQVLYVYSGTNRLSSFRSRIEQRVAQVDAIYDASAQQTGGHRYVRWLTDSDCNLSITAVRVLASDATVAGFTSGLIPRLQAMGYQGKKFLIWADTGASPTITNGVCYGVGTLYPDDDRLASQNLNDLFGGYTRVDDTCLFALFDHVGGKVEAHELMHTLGAVQASAPHSTPYGHCRDDYDVMCYIDGGGVTLINPRPCSASTNELRLDCNHDDYFSTNPPAGSYLATHWNAANSSWLEAHPGAPQEPDPPRTLAGAPGNNAVGLTWTSPAYDGGQPLLGYQVYRNGVLVVPAANPTTSEPAGAGAEVSTTATSFTDTGLVNGTTYNYQVTAVNSVGEGPKTAAVAVMAGVPRPDAQVSVARTGPFTGDNVYFPSMTNNTQTTATQSVARGGSVTAYVRVQNDRPGFDSFKVKGVAAGSSGYTVRYYRGTTDITAQVEAGSYTIDNVASQAFVDLKVKITATTSAAAGSSRSVTVTVKSKTTNTIKDVVQTRAARS